MKAVVAAFNQEKALVGAFSVITNLRMELFEALLLTGSHLSCLCNSAQRSSVLSTETRRLPPSHAQKRKNIPQPRMPSIPEVAQSINFIIYCDLVKVLQLSMSKSMSQFLNWASFFSFINAESCLKKLSDEGSK